MSTSHRALAATRGGRCPLPLPFVRRIGHTVVARRVSRARACGACASCLLGLVWLCWAGFVQPAVAASFACEKAQTAVEKAICSTEETSQLDEYLGRYYSGARMALAHADSCLVANQRAWLREVRDACKDAACLQRVYLERLAVLHALQPGASSLRNLRLPPAPTLVWVVPPAEDQVAAPRNRPAKPLVARGRVVNDVSGGDGYVLQSDTGAKTLILPLMFLQQPSMDALAELARSPSARYEVRGQVDAADADRTAFSSARCSYVYRLQP